MSTLSSTGSLSIGAAWTSSSTLRASAGVSSYRVTVPAEVGDVRVRIVRPPDADGTLPVILIWLGR